MIRYLVDKEKKYTEDLLFTLRAHNKSCTGEKANESLYIYVIKNDQLLGGTRINFSWDWASFNRVFYKNLSVLQELIYKATSLFNDKVVGYNIYTQDEKVYKDFEHFGFYLDTKMQMSTDRGLTYYVMGENIDVESTNQYHVITSKEVVNEYEVIQKKEDEKYKKEFNIKEVVEAVHYVALDGDSFAGGVYMQLYTDSMYIDLLAVKTEYKGQKIGTKLMEYAEELAREKGFESIDLGTTEFQAKPFYEKLGYNVIRTQQNLPKGFECYTLIKQLK